MWGRGKCVCCIFVLVNTGEEFVCVHDLCKVVYWMFDGPYICRALWRVNLTLGLQLLELEWSTWPQRLQSALHIVLCWHCRLLFNPHNKTKVKWKSHLMDESCHHKITAYLNLCSGLNRMKWNFLTWLQECFSENWLTWRERAKLSWIKWIPLSWFSFAVLVLRALSTTEVSLTVCHTSQYIHWGKRPVIKV